MAGDEGRVDPRDARPEPAEAGPGDAAGTESLPAEAADGDSPSPQRPGPASAVEDGVTFEQIRERAYELWERNHRPEGLEIQFWLVAERELRAERDRRDRIQDETKLSRD